MNENEYKPIEGLGFSLSGKQWCLVAAIALPILCYGPHVWSKFESIETNVDYRIPYELSQDYYLYERHVGRSTLDPRSICVVGDSVVWGEYVDRSGTLSHFLNSQLGNQRQFSNAGINGLFPLALEGLVREYGGRMKNRQVLLHCNLLWMSSPEADLSVEKEQVFNHVSLVPQFTVDIPCYRAAVSDRAGIVAEQSLPNLRWSRHLQVCYFDSKSIPDWTLSDDGRYPPGYPNSYANPLEQITMIVPSEPPSDLQRGIESDRHQPWNSRGIRPQSFDWVTLDESLQWAAFQRLVGLLRERGNDVAVVVGPFNEHMLVKSNRAPFLSRKRKVIQWLQQQEVVVQTPTLLDASLYGDASHPLTDGYEALAEQLVSDPQFRAWLERENGAAD